MNVQAPSPTAPRLDADACTSCGAPLADDQRFCLECGGRRAQVTLPRVTVAPPPSAMLPRDRALAVSPPPDATMMGRGPNTLLAVIGCLLLAMGVGVLIGRVGRTSTRTAAPAQVISVSTPAGGAAPAQAATPAAPATTSSLSAPSSSGPKGKPASAPPAIRALQNLTGKQYVQQSKNLPTTTTTGGKPPPVDHKAPGGGTGSVSIG